MLYNKLIILLLLSLGVQISFAQKRDDGVFFIKKDQIVKFHTIGDLENLRKGELIKIYQDRVREIITVIPFLSLTNEPDVRLDDLGIKEDSDHIKILKKNTEAIQEALITTEESIEELIAYADTEKIIWTILYYEDVIKKMRIGANGSF
ncbi:hypothetical protein GCM10022393_20010 [Aquimarina addita]|uniref:Uncharacterized protein n=1 Tax=Aquimarina addita TaxID=870485 RepID=A0ABP6UKE8_9FLAO